MADLYDQILVKGSPRYRRNNVFIKADNVPDLVKEVLTLENIVDDTGTVVVDQKNEEAKTATEADEKAAAKLEADKAAEDGDDGAEQEDTSDADDGGEKEEEAAEEETPPETETPKAKAKPAAKKKAADAPAFRSRVPQSKPGMGFPRKNGKTVDIFDGVTPHTHVKLVGGLTVPLSTESYNSKSDKEIEDRLEELGYELQRFDDRALAGVDDSDLTDEGSGDDDEGSLTDDDV